MGCNSSTESRLSFSERELSSEFEVRIGRVGIALSEALPMCSLATVAIISAYAQEYRMLRELRLTKDIRPVGIAIARSAKQIFTVNGQSVSVFDYEGLRLRGFVDSVNLPEPRAIALQPDGTIFLSCDERVAAVSANFKQTQSTVSRLCFRPGGLCSRGYELYVCDSDSRCVHVYDRRREEIVRSFGNGQLRHPVDCAIDSDGSAFVTDLEEHCVFVFAVDGKLLRRFGSRGSDSGQLQCPRGLAFDLFGHLLVCDHSNARVCQFRPDGSFVSSLSTVVPAGWSKDVNLPHDIAVGGDGSVFVCCAESSRVFVFGV